MSGCSDDTFSTPRLRLKTMKYTPLLFIVFLVSCSTVERYTYYTPTSDKGVNEGPTKQWCGMAQFGKEPDAVVYSGLTFQSNSSFEPYLWGPWLITVVPIFPVTWIVDGVANPNLEISISGDMENYRFAEKPEIVVNAKLKNGEFKSISPETISVHPHGVKVIFPISSNQISSFDLLIKNITMDKEAIELQFKKTSRWAWTQYCIN
jgi:hypothetical protein